MIVKHVPEPDLVSRLVNGDEKAFREVFDRFHRGIYRLAFNLLKDKAQSEEIVQETFLHFWLTRESLDIQQPLAPLLYVIARRQVIDAWRKAVKTTDYRKKVHRFMATVHNDTEDLMQIKELEQITKEVLQKLTEQQRHVFELSRYEGLSYEEIAKRLHISKNTVKYHLVNALKVMREHFNKHDVLYGYFLFLYMI